MARRPTPASPPAEPELRVPAQEAEAKIDERIGKGRDLLKRHVNTEEQLQGLDDDYDKWNAYNRELLGRLFTTSKLANEYSSAGAGPVMMSAHPSSAQRFQRIHDYISGKISGLESIKERLELIPEAHAVQRSVPTPSITARPHTNKAFIVHGHNEAAKEAVARFLEKLGVEPIILHEQATGGRTIAEKLEHYSDVDFAIVLLTPDDVGAAKGDSDKLKPRARQNVILELGFFIGKLTRKHVCALYEGPLELPSDYLGVGYVQLDPVGAWRLLLARELREAGFTIDMNAAL